MIFDQFVSRILALKHRKRRRLILLLDLVALLFASLATLTIESGFATGLSLSALAAAFLFGIVTIAIFTIARVYRAIIRHLNTQTIVYMAMILVSVSALWSLALGLTILPNTNNLKLFLIQWMLTTLGLVGYRMAVLFVLREAGAEQYRGGEQIGIYGTTEMAQQLIASMRHSRDYNPAFLLSDDVSKAGGMIDNVRVYHVDEVDWPINRFAPAAIVFCCSNDEFRSHRQLVEEIVRKGIPVRLYTGFAKADSLADLALNSRSVDIADLIGRQEIPIDRDMIADIVTGKRILVTGGGGSIGSRLCEHLAGLDPELLAVLDFDEKSLVRIRRRIAARDVRTQWCLGDVKNAQTIDSVLRKGRFDIIFHAAAYKHVDLGEEMPAALVANNLLGTHTLISAARKHAVPRFVFISTDKAVAPVSLMGATKRWGEELVRQAASQEPGLRYCSVRFGNVIESSGSVVPLIKRQILDGGPVTITDRRMTRYFMSIDEAVKLILQSASLSQGGETFILKMGDPVSIVEIAETLIKLAGHTIRSEEFPNGEIEIVEIGTRPGERLEEMLFESDESVEASRHSSILMQRMEPAEDTMISQWLKRIASALEGGGKDKILSAVTDGLKAIDQRRANGRQRKQRPARAAAKASGHVSMPAEDGGANA